MKNWKLFHLHFLTFLFVIFLCSLLGCTRGLLPSTVSYLSHLKGGCSTLSKGVSTSPNLPTVDGKLTIIYMIRCKLFIPLIQVCCYRIIIIIFEKGNFHSEQLRKQWDSNRSCSYSSLLTWLSLRCSLFSYERKYTVGSNEKLKSVNFHPTENFFTETFFFLPFRRCIFYNFCEHKKKTHY